MNRSVLLLVVLVAGMLNPGVHGAACPEDHYADFGVLYVDDEPTPFVYLESNAIDALQRQDDGNLHGHCEHPNPDTWLF